MMVDAGRFVIVGDAGCYRWWLLLVVTNDG